MGATGERLAGAAADVVARDGFDALSVRAVTRAAGVAPGTVQFHFPTRPQLLLAAFDHTVAAILRRTAGTHPVAGAAAALGALLQEALPLDEQRRTECAVWAALSAAAANHGELRAPHAAAVALFQGAVEHAIAAAIDVGAAAPGTDIRTAARLLTAVVDGLTLQNLAGDTPHADMISTLEAAIRAAVVWL